MTPWADWEDDIIWEDTLAGVRRKVTLRKLQNRTIEALYARCTRLELSPKLAVRTKLEIFDEIWQNTILSRDEIAWLLGFTKESLGVLAARRGIRRRRTSPREEATE